MLGGQAQRLNSGVPRKLPARLDVWAGVQQLRHADRAAQPAALHDERHVGALARAGGAVEPHHLTWAHQALRGAGGQGGRGVGAARVRGNKAAPRTASAPALEDPECSRQRQACTDAPTSCWRRAALLRACMQAALVTHAQAAVPAPPQQEGRSLCPCQHPDIHSPPSANAARLTSLYFSSIRFQLASNMTCAFSDSRSLLACTGRSPAGGA